MTPADPIQAVLRGLGESPKYRHLCFDTLERTAAWAVGRHPRPKDALKTAKRKLHQVFGAYLQDLDFGRIGALLDGLGAESDQEATRDVCREILASHTSSAERLGFIDRVYEDLFTRTGRPSSVLDIACGLNPFSLPWMGLGPDVDYRCFDIDSRLVSVASRFLKRHRPNAKASCRDVLADGLPIEADLVLLLKSVPCLEQQSPGSTVGILERTVARRVVVSFPNQSLGGADRGMPEHYAGIVDRVCRESGWESQGVSYPTENFYLLGRP